MIPHGTNGKLKGSWIVSELIGKKYISVPEDGLSFDGQRHRIGKVDFSEEVRKVPEIAQSFRECAEEFLRFHSFMEADSSLFVPAEQLGAALSERLYNEPLTGMSLLRLFAGNGLSLQEKEDFTELSVSAQIYDSLPDPEAYFYEAFSRICAYSGEDPELLYGGVTVGERFRTEALGNDLSVTFGEEKDPETLEEMLFCSEAELNAGGKTEREINIENNVRSTLSTLKQMMDDIDGGGEEHRNDLTSYTITFGENRQYRGDGYTVRIPDGFRLQEGAEDREFILWLPNRENPDEWEASLFMLYPDGYPEDGMAGDLPVITETGNGCTIAVRSGDRIRKFTVRAVGTDAPETKEKVREIIFSLFE